MIKLSKQELIDEFKKVKAYSTKDVLLSHTDYLHFIEAEGSAFFDRYSKSNLSVIEDSLLTLCQSNRDILASENGVFLYFHISSHYLVEDITNHMDVVYETCNEESDIAFSVAFDDDIAKDFAEVVMIVTGVN